MSNQALDLLIEYELLKPNGQAIVIQNLPNVEIVKRYSSYVNARRMVFNSEIENHDYESKLNAQFSTWSSKYSEQKALSSLLVYDKVLFNDPLVSSQNSISMPKLTEGLNFFSWLYPLIRSNFVTVFPVEFFNNPSESIPLFSSEDAFRSDIPKNIHDFAHSKAVLKSAIPDDSGNMLILKEKAHVKRRTAICVEFEEDTLYSGVSLYLFQTLEKAKDNSEQRLNWDSKGKLPKEKFDRWAYQATNQAILSRLKAIYDQSFLAQKLGYTYITESLFESQLLSLSGTQNAETISPSVKFLNINDSFVNIDSPNTIIDLREKHPRAFERFNQSLLSVTGELQSIDGELFEQRSKTLFYEEILPQVDEIRRSISQIKTSLVKGTLVSFGGIAAAITTGSVFPLIPALMYGAAGGLTEAIPSVSDFHHQKKKPAYIWHKIIKKT